MTPNQLTHNRSVIVSDDQVGTKEPAENKLYREASQRATDDGMPTIPDPDEGDAEGLVKSRTCGEASKRATDNGML